MDGAATGLTASGYQLIVAPGAGDLSGTTVLEALVDRQVDGIIAIASDVSADWLERLAEYVPLVILGRHDRSQSYDTVTDDDLAGANLVMDHLEGLGHRRIAHLTIRPPSDRSPHALRLRVYRRRQRQAGREVQVIYSKSSESGAYQAARTLLEGSNPPTAIFAGYDTLAIGVLGAIADLEMNAEDVSVVGYDGIDLARHSLISLTTVDQAGADIGMAATELLMERIRDGRRIPKHHRLDPQLRVRSSSRLKRQAIKRSL
jgi:LacI family transcriptional regulator